MEEGGSWEIRARMVGGGGGPLNWEEVLMAVVCGEVSGKARKFSTKMSSIRLE